MRIGVCLTLLLALIPSLRAQDDDDPPEQKKIPVVGRPTADFYNAAGFSSVKLKAEAAPATLPLNESLTYTLTITGLLNARDVEKPSLKALKEFKPFQIDESKNLDPPFDPNHGDRRIFIYRLRPSSEKQTLIPEIVFHYYNPKIVVDAEHSQNKFPKAFSNAVPIHVTPAVKPPPARPMPLDIPGFAESLATENILSSEKSNVPAWIWFVALVVPPMLAVGWAITWQHLYPDAARLLQLKQNRAIRHALAALKRIDKSDDRAAARIAKIMSRYLHERFAAPAYVRTPPEIADHLQSLGFPAERVERATTFFRDCDAVRFAPGHAAAEELAAEAERLIIAMEET